MRSKIPNHIYVMLEQSQVNSGGVVIIQLAKHTFLQELFDLPYGPGKQERVVDHDLQVFLCRKVDQFFRLRRVARERLLYESVLAILKGSLGKFEVRPDGSHYRDRVNFGR